MVRPVDCVSIYRCFRSRRPDAGLKIQDADAGCSWLSDEAARTASVNFCHTGGAASAELWAFLKSGMTEAEAVWWCFPRAPLRGASRPLGQLFSAEKNVRAPLGEAAFPLRRAVRGQGFSRVGRPAPLFGGLEVAAPRVASPQTPPPCEVQVRSQVQLGTEENAGLIATAPTPHLGCVPLWEVIPGAIRVGLA